MSSSAAVADETRTLAQFTVNHKKTHSEQIMPQIEAFVNERIQMEYPNSTAYIKFIEVTTYDKKDRITHIEKAANAGLSVKMEYMALLGYDPIEAIA